MRGDVVHRPLPVDDPRRRRADISRARRLLGWEPRVELDEGLAATFHWFGDEIGARRPTRALPEPERIPAA